MALITWKTNLAKAPREPARQLEQTLKRQIAHAAGTEYFSRKDPIFHIGESFRQTFALLGLRSGSDALYTTRIEEASGLNGVTGGALKQPSDSEAFAAREQDIARRRFEEKTSMDGVFSPSPGDEGFLRRFSETAFNRGTLSGAIMRGTGRMMLISCLKRAAGQSQPKNFRQRMLFQGASATRNIKDHSPVKAVFNKGDLDSALGLVIDATRGARRAVDSLADLAERGFEDSGGSGTLQKLYPFLSVAKEQSLLELYRRALSGLTGPEAAQKRQIVQRAILKTRALIAKKRQMRDAFIHHLRSLCEQASSALHAFEQDEFRAAAFETLNAPPPEEPDSEDEEDIASLSLYGGLAGEQ